MQLTNPKNFSGWLQPHSIEWYNQLSNHQKGYIYTWNSTLTKPNGESIFDEEVALMIANKKVLDVGCGHGKFTIENSFIAKEIIGYDVTDNFIQEGLKNKRENTSFVVGNVKEGLPFQQNEFDCAYIRKGPTSAYPFLQNVVKSEGTVIGLHPGDDVHKELPILFPNLFEPSIGTPILDLLNKRIESSNFSYSNIEIINSIEFIHSPLDLLKLRCFGQHQSIYETLKEHDLEKINKIFNQHSTKEGLPITLSRYLIRAII